MTAIKDDYYHVGLTDEQVRKSRDELMEIVSGEV